MSRWAKWKKQRGTYENILKYERWGMYYLRLDEEHTYEKYSFTETEHILEKTGSIF